jgi:hypothetical protein
MTAFRREQPGGAIWAYFSPRRYMWQAVAHRFLTTANPSRVTLSRDALSLLVEQSPGGSARSVPAMPPAERDYVRLRATHGVVAVATCLGPLRPCRLTTASRGHR